MVAFHYARTIARMQRPEVCWRLETGSGRVDLFRMPALGPCAAICDTVTELDTKRTVGGSRAGEGRGQPDVSHDIELM